MTGCQCNLVRCWQTSILCSLLPHNHPAHVSVPIRSRRFVKVLGLRVGLCLSAVSTRIMARSFSSNTMPVRCLCWAMYNALTKLSDATSFYSTWAVFRCESVSSSRDDLDLLSCPTMICDNAAVFFFFMRCANFTALWRLLSRVLWTFRSIYLLKRRRFILLAKQLTYKSITPSSASVTFSLLFWISASGVCFAAKQPPLLLLDLSEFHPLSL